MRTIRLEIELTYDDESMHGGENDQEEKAYFYLRLMHPEDSLILHSNDFGDDVGEVKVLSIANIPICPKPDSTRRVNERDTTMQQLFRVGSGASGIDHDAARAEMTDIDVECAWRLGLAAWIEAHKRGAKWPHE